MTVTIPFASTRWWRSAENLAVGASLFRTGLAPAKDGTAESISTANPSARPQAALNSGELNGRHLRPFVIRDLKSIFMRVVLEAFSRGRIDYALGAQPLMGNCEANAGMVSSFFTTSYHAATIGCDGTTWPNEVGHGVMKARNSLEINKGRGRQRGLGQSGPFQPWRAPSKCGT